MSPFVGGTIPQITFKVVLLPGAVGAEERHDALLRDAEADVRKRFDAAVRCRHVGELDHVSHGRPPCVPRYASMTRGWFFTSVGVPSAIFSPKLSTVIRSEIDMTSCITCSTRRMVMPRDLLRSVKKLVQALDLARAEAGGGLVEKKKPRRNRERARHLQQLLAAEVEAARLGVPKVLEPGALEDLLGQRQRRLRLHRQPLAETSCRSRE